jgi:hypothetical protein
MALLDFELQQNDAKLKFEFLFKICKSKLWSCFAKVVGLVSMKPTKFVLHSSDFSMNFYDISKALD